MRYRVIAKYGVNRRENYVYSALGLEGATREALTLARIYANRGGEIGKTVWAFGSIDLVDTEGTITRIRDLTLRSVMARQDGL